MSPRRGKETHAAKRRQGLLEFMRRNAMRSSRGTLVWSGDRSSLPAPDGDRTLTDDLIKLKKQRLIYYRKTNLRRKIVAVSEFSPKLPLRFTQSSPNPEVLRYDMGSTPSEERSRRQEALLRWVREAGDGLVWEGWISNLPHGAHHMAMLRRDLRALESIGAIKKIRQATATRPAVFEVS